MAIAAPAAVGAVSHAPSRPDLTQAISVFLSDRTAHLVPGAKAAARPRIKQGVGLQKKVAAFGTVLDKRRDMLRLHGEEYTLASTTVSITGVRQAGDTLTVSASELTKLNYKKVHGDEPDYTAYRLNHIFTFTRADGVWTLASQRPASPDDLMPITEDVPPGPPNDAVDPAASGITRESQKLPADGKLSAPRGGGGVTPMAIPCCLNYTAMVNYAVKYYDNYNTAYRDFSANGGGGDCTNFISQILREGGWTLVGGDGIGGADKTNPNYWWYGWLTQTYTWAGAENWSWFAPKRTTALTNIWYMALADVLQFDFNKDGSMDHTMIVTKKTSTEIYMTYHTSDHLNRTLSSLQSTYGNSAWWYSYRT
jgi:hypothetical protein